ncbi:cilia- and flagella-associated protein 97 isoform X2 [Parambassis ranga]|uniref:Cilia- and flagella-associated protein 97 n=1 Tax=Parambassis ranga TaxID=210632 RepID=A0A6P7HTY3_9TELE|nr:cilia- and flagella-associated protein 97 isoform X2 [Parambassis ranga]
MFNPSELEGEVDHAFFDSDCDNASGDGGRKVVKGSENEKKGPAAHESLQVKDAKIKPQVPLGTDKTIKHLKKVEGKRRSRESSRSSDSCTSGKVISDSSDSEDDSKRSNGTFVASLAGASEMDDDYANNQSPKESEEELSASSKKRNKQCSKKLERNRHTQSPSSTETSTDADSESSYCSRSSSLESPILLKPNKSSLYPGVRRTRIGSAGTQDLPNTHTEDSENTVTDVSPLSSPDITPLQSLDLKPKVSEEGNHKEQQQQEEDSVPSSGLISTQQDEDSDQDMDEVSLSLESQLGSKMVFHCHGGRNRKNFSFTNDEVQRIDRENQRLLRELSRLSPGPRPGSVAGKKTHSASNCPLNRLSHSALNRQREQQRIERDNLAFIKRLESVKPTPGLRRSEQLADHQRQLGYLGASSYPVCRTTTKKERSSSRASSVSRPVSSRAAFTTTDSSNTPTPRSKKLSAGRPAWC